MWTWKTGAVSASARIFPGLIYYDRMSEFYYIGNQIQSSLPLQMVLYINVWVYPLWFLVLLFNLDAKYYYLTATYKFITVTVFIIISLLEGIRLHLGYVGNLAEKIPELASFWLISILIQFPLIMFLYLDKRTLPHYSEKVLNEFMIFLLIMEILATAKALKRLAQHHADRFYLAQLYEMAQLYGINN